MVEAARVDEERTVPVIDSGAQVGRRHETAQNRRDALRIEREFERRRIVGRQFAGLQLQQLLRVDGDRAGLDGHGAGERGGDDLALHLQALHARVDDADPRLVQPEEADEEGHEARHVEQDDAADERGAEPQRQDAPDPPHAGGGRQRATGAGGAGAFSASLDLVTRSSTRLKAFANRANIGRSTPVSKHQSCKAALSPCRRTASWWPSP